MDQGINVLLNDKEKTIWKNANSTHNNRVNKLADHLKQVFSVILGQCTQLLLYEMKQESSWTTVSQSFDPLSLYALMDKVILKQTDDQYPFAHILEQLCSITNCKQGNLTNAQWYEKFNTRCDIAQSVGFTFDVFKDSWEYAAQLLRGAAYDKLTPSEQTTAREMGGETPRFYIPTE